MLHFPLFGDPVVQGVITPAAYLRLRRRAAGLSLLDAAKRLVDAPADLDRVLSLVRRLEMPGRKALHPSTIRWLRRAYPLDVAVYWQLAEESPDRHPRICHACGWTEHQQCPGEEEARSWATPLRCSRCVDAADAVDAGARG